MNFKHYFLISLATASFQPRDNTATAAVVRLAQKGTSKWLAPLALLGIIGTGLSAYYQWHKKHRNHQHKPQMKKGTHTPASPARIKNSGGCCNINASMQTCYSALKASDMLCRLTSQPYQSLFHSYEKCIQGNATLTHDLLLPKNIFTEVIDDINAHSAHAICKLDSRSIHEFSPQDINANIAQSCKVILGGCQGGNPVWPTKITTPHAIYKLTGITVKIAQPSHIRYPEWIFHDKHCTAYIQLDGNWFHCSDESINKLKSYEAVKEHLQLEGTIDCVALAYVKHGQ